MSGQTLIQHERHGAYAIVTLNRPDKMNAVSAELAGQLVDTLTVLEDCSVIVLTGSGRAFCAGIDLSERSQRHASWRSALGAGRAHYWAETVEVIRRHPAVFIAAVNGYALGGGLTLVNNAELAVASEAAQFGMPELGFGSFPALAGPTTVRRLLPKHVAQMVLLAQRITAQQALQWGLVNEVVDADELLPRACQLAEQVAKLDPVAVAFTKRALRSGELLGWSEGIEQGAVVGALVRATRENVASHLEQIEDSE